jgi:hypothetical protein
MQASNLKTFGPKLQFLRFEVIMTKNKYVYLLHLISVVKSVERSMSVAANPSQNLVRRHGSLFDLLTKNPGAQVIVTQKLQRHNSL